MPDQQVMRALGRIEGRLDGVDKQLEDQGKDVGEIKDRMRKVETRAAGAGTMSALGVSLIIAGLKSWVGGGPP